MFVALATCPTRTLKLYGRPAAIEKLLPVVDMWLVVDLSP